MRYHSTRNPSQTVSGAQAVVAGLAPDGGLYVPQALPDFPWQSCLCLSTQQIAAAILGAMLPDIPHMEQLVARAYTGKFETEDLTPTLQVGPFHMLELFRGPTSAFKDVALSMLPQLMSASKAVLEDRQDTLILTATSGDTGKAALVGFQDVPGVKICVFYPQGGVSQVQQAQMVTQEGANVSVCAVRGNFDDAQRGVKEIFTACQGKDLPFRLSSANSINIGRLVPQITYYFTAYRDLLAQGAIALGDRVNFSVPTGNFGDILAGYLAKGLGLPVGRLICASNANNVLTDFIRTGTYDRNRPLLKTTSPSMDILVSSNLERLLYFLSGDCALVARLMEALRQEGRYTVPQEMLQKIQQLFWGDFCGDAQGQAVIRRVYRDHHYLCDPHTAAGWAAAERYAAQAGDTAPTVVLSTASPFKFPQTVLTAIGQDPAGDGFQQMAQLSQATGLPIPKNLAGLKEKQERHTQVIEKEEMLSFVLNR